MGDLGFGEKRHVDSCAALGARALGSLGRRALQIARPNLLQHSLDDEGGGDRQAAVVQKRAQLRLLHARLQCEQAAELRIAILLDYEYHAMIGEEALDILGEWEGPHTHV